MFFVVPVAFSDISLVVIFQETARNHLWEAGMLMQSYMLETVQYPMLNNTCPVCTPENGPYANYRGQRSPSAFLYLKRHINVNNGFWVHFFQLIWT